MANKQKAWRTAAGKYTLPGTNIHVRGQGKRLRDTFTKFVPVPSFLVQALLMRGGWAYQQEVQHA